MRIQMINSVHLEQPGSRLIFNGGEFYIVEDQIASDFISAGNAIDPENPPVEVDPIEENTTNEDESLEVTD